MADTFTNHKIVAVTDDEGVPLPEFQIPKLRSFLHDNEETEAEVAALAAEAAKDPKGVAREVVASRKFIGWMNASYKEMTEGRRQSENFARVHSAAGSERIGRHLGGCVLVRLHVLQLPFRRHPPPNLLHAWVWRNDDRHPGPRVSDTTTVRAGLWR